MNPAEILDVLESRKAILRGHFELSSGRHSDTYVQKFRIFEQPRLTQRFGDSIAELFDGEFDVVASPAVGAIVLGFATALAAETRMIFAERLEGHMEFRRGFELAPHERALVVEDVVTTGASAAEVVALVRSKGATPIGIGALLDRRDATRTMDLRLPLRALANLETTSWGPDSCPMCDAGQPLTVPGSRTLSP